MSSPDAETPEQKYTARDEKLLRDTVSMLANFIWTRKTRLGEHMWTIPADPQRDFDCILIDAIDELVHLRATVASQAHPPDDERRTCNDCKRELPWWGVDDAGRCGRCYESMNLTLERRRAEQAEAQVASQAHTLSTVEQELAALKAEYALAISWGWRPDVAQLAYRRLEAKLEAHPHPRSERGTLEKIVEQIGTAADQAAGRQKPEYFHGLMWAKALVEGYLADPPDPQARVT